MLVAFDVPEDIANDFIFKVPKESHNDFKAFVAFIAKIDPKRIEEILVLPFQSLNQR